MKTPLVLTALVFSASVLARIGETTEQRSPEIFELGSFSGGQRSMMNSPEMRMFSRAGAFGVGHSPLVVIFDCRAGL